MITTRPEEFECPCCRAEMQINERLNGLECSEECSRRTKNVKTNIPETI